MCTLCELFRPEGSGSVYYDISGTGAGTALSGTPTYSVDQVADYLTAGYWSSGGERRFDVGPGGQITVDISTLTATGQDLARKALASWSDVTGIVFVEQVGGADILFDDEDSGAYATHYYSNHVISSAYVNVNKNWNGGDPDVDSYHFQTYLHEIGHALGIGHAGGYNGSATYGFDNHYANDSWQMSLMSYFDQSENTAVDASFAYAITPMIADILAIQSLYGTPATRSGDTVYGEGGNTGTALDTWLSLAQPVTFTIWDSGGTDLIDLSGQAFAQRIDLTPEAVSDVQGLIGNMLIARGTVIENVSTGSGADSVTGNAGNNTIRLGAGGDSGWGGAGCDRLEGGAGNDTLYGGDHADTLLGGTGLDILRGEAGDDRLAGDDGDDDLDGGTGDDKLWGGAGADLLAGGAGNDTVYGAAGNDRAEGGDGDDLIFGGAQEDTLLGGEGADALYGDAGFDDLFGDGGDDWLDGGAQADRLWGGTGADTLKGGDGDDRLFGDQGDDTLEGGSGVDRLRGGTGEDTLAGGDGDDWLYGDAGFDLLQGGAGDDWLDGGAQADNLYGGDGADTLLGSQGFDRLFGGADADTLMGGSDDDALFGEDGDDQLYGEEGDDRLFGGQGNDTLAGGQGNDTLDGNAGFDRLDGGAGNDTLRGGFNADVFVFADGCGSDTVLDFEAANLYERIDVSGLTAITDWLDLSLNHLSWDASNCYIDAGGGDSITLLGIGLPDLDAGDFVF